MALLYSLNRITLKPAPAALKARSTLTVLIVLSVLIAPISKWQDSWVIRH